MRKRPPNRALVLATACCAVCVGFGSLFIFTFGVFLKPLSAAFGWSRGQVSIGFTAGVLMVAACSPIVGRLLDRYPARRVVLPCTFIYGLAFASLALLTRHLWHFVLVLALMGAVGIATTQLGYAGIVSAWYDRARGRALAAVMAGSGLGSMIFPPLAQFLISAYGWRAAYALLSLLILFLGLPLAFAFLYEPEERTRSSRPQATSRERVLADVRSFPFIAIVLALLLFSLATNGLNTHWAALLTDVGISPPTAAAVLSVAGFTTLASKLSTGYLLDRFVAHRTVALLFVICAAGFLAVLYGRATWMAFAAAGLVGIGMGAESDAVPYLLARYFGLARFGELYGYTWSVYALAGGLGPALAGAIYDRTGSYAAALWIFLAMVMTAAGLFATLPRSPRM